VTTCNLKHSFKLVTTDKIIEHVCFSIQRSCTLVHIRICFKRVILAFERLLKEGVFSISTFSAVCTVHIQLFFWLISAY